MILRVHLDKIEFYIRSFPELPEGQIGLPYKEGCNRLTNM